MDGWTGGGNIWMGGVPNVSHNNTRVTPSPLHNLILHMITMRKLTQCIH